MSVPESRTVIVRDALVHVTPSRTMHGDITATDSVLPQAGPAQSPGQDETVVLDAAGASVVPVVIDGAV
ncbi:hypothetical protein [Streptomyces acidicola]|uniref:hypothetical protein n=1 Tax=Streptomyces acidicola TaxID=2596892 RepID=UPI00343CE95A